jgi:hypothetical protein
VNATYIGIFSVGQHRSEAMIHLAMIDLMARRCTGESTPTWRGT